MIKAFIDYEFKILIKNNYLLCGGNFFLQKIHVFLYLDYIFLT